MHDVPIIKVDKSPCVSSPIIQRKGFGPVVTVINISVHRGQKNPEIKINNIFTIRAVAFSLVLDGRMASLKAHPARPTGSPKHLRR